jgi:hypothetical protein
MKNIVRDRKHTSPGWPEQPGKEDDGNDQHLRALDDAESHPTDEDVEDSDVEAFELSCRVIPKNLIRPRLDRILADHSRARRVRAPFARARRGGASERARVLPSSSHPHLQEHGEHPTI